MRILVVGSGGREHTLVWKISHSPKVQKIYCAPGNGGIEAIAECVDIEATDISSLVKFARKKEIDLTVVGPEGPLCNGIVDEFEKVGLRIFGPSRLAARLEGSKIFAKELMVKYGIPTAEYRIFDNSKDAIAYLDEIGAPIVVKADGLAKGKGSIICNGKEEAFNAVRKILDEKIFGESGDRIIVEECLRGEEASLLAFTDGKTVLPMDSAQDHKPIYDNDTGPNTGGMGAYSPAPVVTEALYQQIDEEVLTRTVRALSAEGIVYKGVIYAGLMLTESGPKVLEFNVRYGDPENQALMPRLENDLVEVMEAVVDGELRKVNLKWKRETSVCVVMASGGYPGSYEKGKEITGLDRISDENVIVFHAGTRKIDDKIVTSGGRVLGVTALGSTVEQAMERAYNAVRLIHFEKAHYRRDIGAKALKV